MQPELDAAATDLLHRTLAGDGRSATAWDLLVALIDGWDAALAPLATTFGTSREEMLARMEDADAESDAGSMRSRLMTASAEEAVSAAQREVALVGSPAVSPAHLLLGVLSMMPGSNVELVRALLSAEERRRDADGSVLGGWTDAAPQDPTISWYRSGGAVIRSTVLPRGEVRMPLAPHASALNRLAERMGPMLHYALDGSVMRFGGWWWTGLGRFDSARPARTYGLFYLALSDPPRVARASTLNGSPTGAELGVQGTVDLRLLRANAQCAQVELVIRNLPIVREDNHVQLGSVDAEVEMWAEAAVNRPDRTGETRNP